MTTTRTTPLPAVEDRTVEQHQVAPQHHDDAQHVETAHDDHDLVDHEPQSRRRTAVLGAGGLVLAAALFGGGFATGHAMAGDATGLQPGPGAAGQGVPGQGGPMGQDGQLPTPPDGQAVPPGQDGTAPDGTLPDGTGTDGSGSGAGAGATADGASSV